MQKADKKFNSSVGWFSSSTTKYEEAGDLYQEAANLFKLDKFFKESGDAFMREADCREKGGEKDEAANALWNAAKSYKQGYPEKATQALSATISLLTSLGRFRQAADREKEIGQIYLQESQDLSRASESFIRAGDWYEQEDAKATANACFKDAADLLAELDRYQEAIQLYDKVANYSLSSALTKYSVKEYWLKSGLCSLAAQDPVTARRNLNRYSTQDVTFLATREAKFLDALIKAVEDGDQEAFTGVVIDYNEITPLDNWKTSILLKIKKGFQEEPSLT